jgi:hypothetical protein
VNNDREAKKPFIFRGHIAQERVDLYIRFAEMARAACCFDDATFLLGLIGQPNDDNAVMHLLVERAAHSSRC